jgi:cell division transport system permease protein
MRLVGASRWMTELPFMIETIIATVAGGIIAFGMVAFGKHFVLNNIFAEQTRNGVIPNLNVNDLLIASGLGLIGGIVLSAIIAIATLRLYVRL